MILTDTHAHLYSEAFDADRDRVMEDAIGKGITRFFIPAIDSAYIPAMLRLQAAYPEHVYLMSGLHPTHVKENFREELRQVKAQLESQRIYAVGETGMDLYWDKTFRNEQEEAFRYQIELARTHELPIVIHCREAFDEIFTILEEEQGQGLPGGIFHCFTGSLSQARRAIGLGLKLGIGGVVTYKNGKIADFLDQIGLEHIVLETDAPYLAPVPYRGKRNESAYLTEVLKKVAALYKRDPEEVAAITTRNSQLIFGV